MKNCGEMTVAALSVALQKRELSAREAAESCLCAIEERGGGIGAFLTVTRELGTPRLPSITGVLKGEEHEIPLLDACGAGADPAKCGLNGSPTQVARTYIPQGRGQAVEIAGDTAQQAARLAEIIREVL